MTVLGDNRPGGVPAPPAAGLLPWVGARAVLLALWLAGGQAGWLQS
jgi:hypothetical protein